MAWEIVEGVRHTAAPMSARIRGDVAGQRIISVSADARRAIGNPDHVNIVVDRERDEWGIAPGRQYRLTDTGQIHATTALRGLGISVGEVYSLRLTGGVLAADLSRAGSADMDIVPIRENAA